jgi:hypothetical protein
MKIKTLLILGIVMVFNSFGWMTYAILGGSRLSDKKTTIFKKYGTPFDSVKYEDGVISYMFWRDSKKNAYIAYEIFPDDTTRICSIQISAKDGIYWEGINGVNLTSPVDTLIKKFGKPSKNEYLEDVKSDHYLYDNGNYSFEIHNGKVNSIKIMTRNLEELKLLDEYKDKIHIEF